MPKRSGYGKRTPRRRRPTRRPTKAARRRPSYLARPMRALRSGYRGVPNQYRYVRETIPIVIDLGATDLSSTPFIRAVDTGGVMKELNFKAFTMAGTTAGALVYPGLSGFVQDFGGLYQRYKVDEIEIILRPMWHSSINTVDASTPEQTYYPDLIVTRMNTRYMNADLTGGTLGSIEKAIAETQLKTQSGYSDKRPLKFVTKNPRVYANSVIDQAAPGANFELTTMKAPWLNIADQSDVEFAQNSMIWIQRRDHQPFVANFYKYEVKFRVTFRCCQVT